MRENNRKINTVKAVHQFLRNHRGMTLVEVIAVVVIIAGIAAMAVTNIMPRMEKSKVKQTTILISRVAEAVDSFYLDCSYYPSTEDGLQALVIAPEGCESCGPDPYLKNGRIPRDSWNNEFVYEYDADRGQYNIISYGKDRVEGGEGLNADISSQEL